MKRNSIKIARIKEEATKICGYMQRWVAASKLRKENSIIVIIVTKSRVRTEIYYLFLI